MRGLWWAGHVMLAVGLGWWALDWVLQSLLPLQWGGPNIGGGLLLLLAQALALLGAGLAVLMGLALLSTRRLWRRRLVAPLVVNAVLAVALIVVKSVLPGDVGYNGWQAGIVGDTGVTVNEAGQPVLVLAVCVESVDHITVVGPNRGDEPNEVFLELSSDEPVTGLTLVDLAAPGPRWGGGDPTPLPVKTQELLIATAESSRTALRQVDFTAADLAALEPSTVLAGDGRVPLDDFQRSTCEERQAQG